jgi:hypothetical protein
MSGVGNMSVRVVSLIAALGLCGTAFASPRASSELKDSDGSRHGAALAFDGLLSTGWAEGEMGDGAGSWIELTFDRPTDVTSVSIWPGNLSQGRRSFVEYGRPRTLTVTLFAVDGSEVSKQERLPDGRQERIGPQRIDLPLEAKAKRLRVTIDDVYEGGVFNDTFISEIAVNFVDGVNPAAVQKLLEFEESPAGQKAKQQDYDEVVALLTRIEAAEFGDRDALRELMDRAGDGAPYLRKQLSRVPAGFRVQALPPEENALKALQKIRDANAIPAFEMAALRSSGQQQKLFELQTEFFQALSELVGGGDRNIPNWGKPGWERGAFRSFGEPINLQANPLGDVYVADIGNHRVSRFTPEGRVGRVWGSEPGVANVWFSGTRRYHVVGSEPGQQPGQFSNPVDLALMPGKEGDGFVVLDATGRVQIFSESGAPIRSWNVRSRHELRPNVGGEGHVVFSRGRVVVAWRNEVFVYGLDGEELQSFKLEDGVPNGLLAQRNGKLLMIFGDELVEYSPDGFRHGSLMRASTLGTGIEDWAIALDEKGKLWAVTDTGIVAKFKRPGRVDFAVKASEIDLIRPRLAVFDGLAYITDRERILRVDALELRKKEEIARKDAGT